MKFVLMDSDGYYYSGKKVDDKYGGEKDTISKDVQDAVVFTAERTDDKAADLLVVSPDMPDIRYLFPVAVNLRIIKEEDA